MEGDSLYKAIMSMNNFQSLLMMFILASFLSIAGSRFIIRHLKGKIQGFAVTTWELVVLVPLFIACITVINS